MKYTTLLLTVVLISLPLHANSNGVIGGPLVDSLENIDISGSPDGVVLLPSTVHPKITDVFERYTKILADDGTPIHFLVHKGVGNPKIVHARRILEQHLRDVPGSLYGSDKAIVRFNMGIRRATMIFFPDEDAFENGPPAVDDFMDAYEAPMQDLLGDEIILAGSSNYTSNFNPRRDASYEELLHLAHGYGINPGMPALKLAIEQAATNAVNKGWYSPPPGLPKVDIPFEYFAFTMETWYGLWRHDPNNGEYVFSTRAEMEAGDPLIVTILEGFVPKYHVHRATLVPKFAGTFLTEDTSGIEYTYKSRYLTDVEIGGGKNNNVEGNDQPGFLTGNTGDNRLEGRGGPDRIDGNAGTDTAVYRGARNEYGLYLMDGNVTVDDSQASRDARDHVTTTEWLEFTDQSVATSSLTDAANHYCNSTINSTGVMATINVIGSPAVMHQELTLLASQMPLYQFGYFLASQTSGFVSGPGGSQGDLCLGGKIARFSKDLRNAGTSGSFSLDVDMMNIPANPPVAINPGETWHFVAWFRDKNPTPTSNFTGGVSVLFQ